jgi:D-serine deaminase-like pyridoxal phosphate-dependent protein
MSTVEDLPTPALLVDVDRLGRNLDRMAKALAGKGIALRPHVKTSKCWEVVRRQLDSGAIGMTCSTPAEVAWLKGKGVPDLLWAHVPVGPRKVEFAVATARDGGLTIALDSVEAALALSGKGVTVPFVLEVDTGHGRLGVRPERAVEVASAIAALPGLELRGVLTHEGHVGAAPDRAALERAGTEAGHTLVRTADALRAAGHDVSIVSIGSTPGATTAPFVPGITEARPGTYAYFDANQVRIGSCTLDDCALTVLARVVSRRPDGTAIIDAGVKAMSSDTIGVTGFVGRVVGPVPGDGEIGFPEANEEHGFLRGPGAAALRVGDLVRIVPNNACGTTNMWSHVYPVSGAEVLGDWPVAARY